MPEIEPDPQHRAAAGHAGGQDGVVVPQGRRHARNAQLHVQSPLETGAQPVQGQPVRFREQDVHADGGGAGLVQGVQHARHLVAGQGPLAQLGQAGLVDVHHRHAGAGRGGRQGAQQPVVAQQLQLVQEQRAAQHPDAEAQAQQGRGGPHQQAHPARGAVGEGCRADQAGHGRLSGR